MDYAAMLALELQRFAPQSTALRMYQVDKAHATGALFKTAGERTTAPRAGSNIG